MPKISFVCLTALLIPVTMLAQGCNPIKTYAFARPFIPGNAIAEDQPGGRPEDRLYIYEVYLETNCKQPPQIPVAWIDGVSYTTHLTAMPNQKVAAGIYEGRDDTAFVKATGKNVLYQIAFQQETTAHALPIAYQKTGPRKVLLQVQVAGKTKLIQTAPAQMLQPQEVY